MKSQDEHHAEINALRDEIQMKARQVHNQLLEMECYLHPDLSAWCQFFCSVEVSFQLLGSSEAPFISAPYAAAVERMATTASDWQTDKGMELFHRIVNLHDALEQLALWY